MFPAEVGPGKMAATASGHDIYNNGVNLDAKSVAAGRRKLMQVFVADPEIVTDGFQTKTEFVRVPGLVA